MASLESEIARLKDLQERGDHGEVVRMVEPLAADHPENSALLFVAAVSLRKLGRPGEALGTLDRLQALQPGFARGHEERGLCLLALGDTPRAIDALRKAVAINPAMPASWGVLEGLYRAQGDERNRVIAAAHVATLGRLPEEVVRATALFFDGELESAEAVIRGFLARNPKHAEAMRLLANIGVAREALAEAEQLYAAVLKLAPRHHAARYEYAATLARRHKYVEAQDELRLLLGVDPRNASYRLLKASIALGLGDDQEAIGIYRDLLKEFPQAHDIHLWLAHALKTAGDLPQAIEYYRAAAALRPDYGEAYWSLANLKSYRFSDEEIARMRAAETAPATSFADRYHLSFALGKAQEDRGVFAESWRFYERGNAMKRSQIRYRPEIIEEIAREQAEVCTRSFFEERRGWGDTRRGPIFIVGLPRSGSTLIEQILASHSKVEGTQELFGIQRIVLDLHGEKPDLEKPRYPKVLQEMGAAKVRELAKRYMEEAQLYRTGKLFFIDKMPNNFRDIGLIHLMLPNAGIIDVRREPVACCLSNLQQLFAGGQEFTYSVEEIARYYRTYLELMRHWNEALPGRVLRVHYEDVVEDLEGNVRRILDYCGLPFEPSCLAFYKTKRSVRTPSSEQVRSPLFRDGLDRWKNYALWLGALRDALGDAVERYRD